jgi:hypothetical protein
VLSSCPDATVTFRRNTSPYAPRKGYIPPRIICTDELRALKQVVNAPFLCGLFTKVA